MEVSSLTTTTNTGSQSAARQDLQASKTAAPGTKSSDVQPGTASSLLSSSNGISLSGTPLTTVSLSSSSASTVAPAPIPKPHHIDTWMFALPLIIIIIAALSIPLINRSAKTTT